MSKRMWQEAFWANYPGGPGNAGNNTYTPRPLRRSRRQYAPGGAAVKVKNKKNKSSGIFTMSKKIRKYYRKGSKQEKKYKDLELILQSPLDDQGNVFLLNGGIIQGTGVSQRVGKEILLKSIWFRLKAKRNIASNDTIRFVLFYTKNLSVDLAAAGPDCANFILQYPSAGYRQILSPLNLSHTSNFVVLKDVTQELDNGHGEDYFYQFYHKCNIPVKYLTDKTTGGATDFSSGQLWLWITSENLAITAATVAFSSRVRYTDV